METGRCTYGEAVGPVLCAGKAGAVVECCRMGDAAATEQTTTSDERGQHSAGRACLAKVASVPCLNRYCLAKRDGRPSRGR